MKTIDLHCHTTESDGSLTPRELVRLAKARGLSAIAITDHDTVSGIAEALDEAGKLPSIDIIPGIELSSYYYGDVHILGYDLDFQGRDLESNLRNLRAIRNKRNDDMITKFNKLGISFSVEDLRNESRGQSIGRPHFASLLIKKGVVKDFYEAFDKYLGQHRGVCFVEKDKVHPREAIELISKNNGVAVLAHPVFLHDKLKRDIKAFLIELISYGLKGIEVYHPEHSKADREFFLSVANDLNLCVTGGSDFHGKLKPNIDLGVGRGDISVSYHLLNLLLSSRN